jgi:hypothetical protein
MAYRLGTLNCWGSNIFTLEIIINYPLNGITNVRKVTILI